MDTTVLENRVRETKWLVRPVEKKSFEEACAECNAAPVEMFIDELRKRVKERYQNAKS